MGLGPKKSLSSLRLELMSQGIAQHTNVQSRVWYHSAIQGPNLQQDLQTGADVVNNF